MFGTIKIGRAPLLTIHGDTVAYWQKGALLPRPVSFIIDENPAVIDPNGTGGAGFKSGPTIGSMSADEPFVPKQDDVVAYEGRRWKVMAPKSDGIWWDMNLQQLRDTEEPWATL